MDDDCRLATSSGVLLENLSLELLPTSPGGVLNIFGFQGFATYYLMLHSVRKQLDIGFQVSGLELPDLCGKNQPKPSRKSLAS